VSLDVGSFEPIADAPPPALGINPWDRVGELERVTAEQGLIIANLRRALRRALTVAESGGWSPSTSPHVLPWYREAKSLLGVHMEHDDEEASDELEHATCAHCGLVGGH
jgi:hypothetical protein